MTCTVEQAAALRSFREQGLSTRAAYALVHLGCLTLDDAAKLTDLQLMRTPNCGKKTISEIMGHRRYASKQSNWQRIETAPKPSNGPLVAVDLWVMDSTGGHRVTDAYWLYDLTPEPRWYGPNEAWGESGPINGTPTHWMSLPKPPVQSASSP